MLNNTLLSLVLVASVVLPHRASAQDASQGEAAEAAADTDEEARVLYLRGDRLYNEGRYEEATAAFQESFDLSGRPGLLFNLANAYERLGQLEEALQALQRFAPDAPEHQRSTVNTRISTLQTRLREQDEARRAEQASPSVEVAPVEAPRPTPAPAPAPSSSAATPVGVTLLVLGVGALGGGLAAALLARSSRANLDEACIGTLCPASASGDFDAESRRALTADILLFGGGALVLGGVIALIAGASSDEDSAHLDVAPTLGGASATLSGRF